MSDDRQLFAALLTGAQLHEVHKLQVGETNKSFVQGACGSLNMKFSFPSNLLDDFNLLQQGITCNS